MGAYLLFEVMWSPEGLLWIVECFQLPMTSAGLMIPNISQEQFLLHQFPKLQSAESREGVMGFWQLGQLHTNIWVGNSLDPISFIK